MWKVSWEIGDYQSVEDGTINVSLQVRFYVSRIHGKHDDTIFVTQLPLQSIHKLDSCELTLPVQGRRALLPSYLGIGDPVVFERSTEVVLCRGCNPDNPAGI